MSDTEDVLADLAIDTSAFESLMEGQNILDQARDEIQTLLNANDSLEALILTIESTPSFDVHSRRLLFVSCENLLRGTGYEVKDLIPSMESETISTESLKVRKDGIWKKIVAWVLRVLAALKTYWNRLTTYQGQLRISAESTRKRAAVARGKTVKTQTIELGIEAKSFVIGSSSASDADTIIRAISGALDQYKLMMTRYPKGMLDTGSSFEKLYKSGQSDLRQLLEDFNAATANLPFSVIATQLRALSYKDARFGNKTILAAPPVIGGYSLFIQPPEAPTRGLAAAELVSRSYRLRTAGIRFMFTDPNAQNVTSATIRTANGQQAELLAQKVLGILDAVTENNAKRLSKQIDSQIKSMLSAAEEFKSKPYTDQEGSAIYTENILRFARTYASWASGPLDQMTTNLLTVARSILIYANKSLKA